MVPTHSSGMSPEAELGRPEQMAYLQRGMPLKTPENQPSLASWSSLFEDYIKWSTPPHGAMQQG
jgi:hypothetical protein